MLPISEPARIGGGNAINGKKVDRHKKKDTEHKRQTDAHQPAAKEIPASSANERRPYKDAGEKKHHRHQRDILKGGVNVECEPSLIVENWRRQPMIGRTVEEVRRRRLRSQIS